MLGRLLDFTIDFEEKILKNAEIGKTLGTVERERERESYSLFDAQDTDTITHWRNIEKSQRIAYKLLAFAELIIKSRGEVKFYKIE